VRAARGERLYALVETYAGLGDHRTGTTVDTATRQWFAQEIEQRGGVVEELPYEFEQYVATGRVTAGGRELPMVPLFYSGVGEVDSAEPYIAEIDPTVTSVEADDALAVARASGYRVAVLATRAPEGRLVGINRAPSDPPGPIAVLVPGDAIDALRSGPVHVRVDARTRPATSATLVGRFTKRKRSRGRPPVVVTTPLTGWFGCAGERGTGIAVAFELANELAAKQPVVLVATTGHEIGFTGMHHYLANHEVDACAVIQLGASVAASEGDHAETRVALVDGLMPDLDEPLSQALAPSGFRTMRHEGPWPTEGDGWRRRGIPVVSYVAVFDRFHTPDDVPHAVTSPAFLDAVAGALLDAARLVAPLT
jgi:hypothetical protein